MLPLRPHPDKRYIEERLPPLLLSLCSEEDSTVVPLVSVGLFGNAIHAVSWDTHDSIKERYDQEGLVPQTSQSSTFHV